MYLQLVETYSICSAQVEFEDKVTPKYLKRPTPSTSLSNIEIDIAVAASNLRSLPISIDLVFSMLSVSFFRFRFFRAVLDRSSLRAFSLKIFYVRGVAVQNSYVRIKVLTALGRSFMQTRKSKGPRMLPCGTP